MSITSHVCSHCLQITLHLNWPVVQLRHHLPDGGGGGGGGGGDVGSEGGVEVGAWEAGGGCRSGGDIGSEDSAGDGGGCVEDSGSDGGDTDGCTGPGGCAGDGNTGWTPCSQLKPSVCYLIGCSRDQQCAISSLCLQQHVYVAVDPLARAGDVLFCRAGTGPGGIEGKFDAASAAADGVLKSTWSSGMPNGMGSAGHSRDSDMIHCACSSPISCLALRCHMANCHVAYDMMDSQ